MSAPFSITQIEWRGVQIEITFHPRRWRSEFDRIEIHVIGDGLIPITETGYRSRYLPAGITDEYGGPDAYVKAWLDHEAETPEWKLRVEDARQLSLF